MCLMLLRVGTLIRRPRRSSTLVSLSTGLLNASAATFTNATYWSASTTTLTGSQGDPNSGSTGCLMTEDAAGTHTYGINAAAGAIVTITGGAAVTGGVWAKKGTCLFLRLILSSGDFSVGAVGWFNLNAGTKTSTATFAGSPTSVTGAISAAASAGFYFCSVSAILASSTDAKITVRMSNADADDNDTGTKTMTVAGPRITQP
jgi:hypothetical protein